MREVIAALAEALQHDEPVALATVVDVQGASPAQLGFKMALWPDGRAVGTIGGGGLEQHVRDAAALALREGRPRLAHYTLREQGADAVGMACGGEVSIFIDVFQPLPRLLIVGGGHLGRPLAEMARLAGWSVDIVDLRPERGTVPELDPSAITPWTYVVIVTATHATDQETLRRVLDSPAAYIGMIGSRRKVRTIFNELQSEGLSADRLARIRAPIGLDLGGRSPAEIAVAILAEIIQVRYGGSGEPRMLGSEVLRQIELAAPAAAAGERSSELEQAHEA
jgi:xanthine dehydrogenase accessory factor